MQTKEYHINKQPGGNYTWVRTDGLMNTHESPFSFPTYKACVEAARRNANSLVVTPIIIRGA